ncbi:hypothetical protein Tco_0701403, partial [Tanacetum coccineum]
KSASTPVDLEKPLVKDGDADDVDVYLYRSMIGSLMYLIASRPDIMFAVCACARFQVTPKTSHLLVVKRIFRYLKGKPTLGLWYSRDSPFEIVAYIDSDYAGATQDRKSTTKGCQFLGNRLISWQCKKQTMVATSTTKAEYVAAASCCGQASQKEVGTLRYLSLVVPLKKVGDEAVHKELGNRIERAATTASSLEAKQDNAQTRFETTSKQSNDPPLSRVNTLGSGEDNMKLMELMAHYTTLSKLNLNSLSIHQMASLEFCDKHNMVAYLEKSEGSEGFHQIIDFLTASHIKNGLTECPTLYASLIEQFWQTVALSTTEDGLRGITATIDRKVKVFVSEASIRRHLKLEDYDGISSLPTAEIFEQLALMGRDKGSLSLNELTVLCTSLSKKVESMKSELKQTKQTFHAALTKLIKRVKKLEQTIKISQARRRAKVVISDTEEDEEDPSKQGRRRIDDTQISDQPEEQLGVFSADAARRRQSVENVHTYTRRSRLVSTADVSTVSELGSTAGVKAKDKGKAIIQEFKPPKKIKKRVQVQMIVDEELSKKAFEEEQAKFKVEEEQEKSDFETALELQKQLDEREEVVAQTHDIDWSDPAVLRHHTLQNRPFSIAEDQNQAFVPKDYEIEKEVMKRSGFDLQQEFVKKDEASSFTQKQPARGSRKKSLTRKRSR